MTATIELSTFEIKSRAGDAVFARGYQYYKNKAIYNPVRRGDVLEALCYGSYSSKYRVRASFSEDGEIEETYCTCPYDFGDDCKHMVALLLTYLNEPDSFTEMADSGTQNADLQSRSKDELIDLIFQMVERHPDLRIMLERPPASASPDKLDLSSIRLELQQNLPVYEEWGDTTALDTLNSVYKTAEGFIKADNWVGAAEIYVVVIEEGLKHQYELIQDENGETYVTAGEAVDKLADCIRQPVILDDDELRQKYLDVLMTVYTTPMDWDGFGDDVDEYLTMLAKPQDVAALRQHLKIAIDEAPYEWTRSRYADLDADLALLADEDLDTVLDNLRENGMYRVLAEKLLANGRVDEAIAVIENDIQGNVDFPLIHKLVQAGRENAAVRIVEGMAKNTHNIYGDHALYWLINHYQHNGDDEQLLRWQIKRMDMRNASFEHYLEVKKTAERLGNWQQKQPEVIKLLRSNGSYSALVRVYLSENQFDEAEKILDKVLLYDKVRIELEFAQAISQTNPQKAIEIYRKHVFNQIAQRSRPNYAQAASYLAVIRELYLEFDEEAWLELIRHVRSEFKQLRALQDEMNKAGLEKS
ncbi:MAG: SWIM zinc finger family protein [Chloroflexi bacterium]|nr:SWIM zinc finger family protein [Chloroflexota bacterium]